MMARMASSAISGVIAATAATGCPAYWVAPLLTRTITPLTPAIFSAGEASTAEMVAAAYCEGRNRP